jgi:divalent metal cation (Fe/Co/Zn/Cd) transporter
VAIGALGVWVGFERADPIVGLVISVAVFAVLRGAARQVWYRLMDAVDPAIIDRIETSARGVDGVEAVNTVQARWLGHRLVTELNVAVDHSVSVRDGHTIAARVSHRLLHDVAHLDEAHVHIDPSDIDPPDHRHRH